MQMRGLPTAPDGSESAAKAGIAVRVASAAIASLRERLYARRAVIGDDATCAMGNARASGACWREFAWTAVEADPRPYQMWRRLPCRRSADMLGRRSLVACKRTARAASAACG